MHVDSMLRVLNHGMRDVNKTESQVLWCLALCANKDSGVAWPSTETLAAYVHIKDKAPVRRALKALTVRGYLENLGPNPKAPKNRATIGYRITVPCNEHCQDRRHYPEGRDAFPDATATEAGPADMAELVAGIAGDPAQMAEWSAPGTPGGTVESPQDGVRGDRAVLPENPGGTVESPLDTPGGTVESPLDTPGGTVESARGDSGVPQNVREIPSSVGMSPSVEPPREKSRAAFAEENSSHRQDPAVSPPEALIALDPEEDRRTTTSRLGHGPEGYLRAAQAQSRAATPFPKIVQSAVVEAVTDTWTDQFPGKALPDRFNGQFATWTRDPAQRLQGRDTAGAVRIICAAVTAVGAAARGAQEFAADTAAPQPPNRSLALALDAYRNLLDGQRPEHVAEAVSEAARRGTRTLDQALTNIATTGSARINAWEQNQNRPLTAASNGHRLGPLEGGHRAAQAARTRAEQAPALPAQDTPRAPAPEWERYMR